MKNVSETSAANSKRMMLMLAIAFAHGALPTASPSKRPARVVAAEPVSKTMADARVK